MERRDHDSLWKEAIDSDFPAFFSFFQPQAAAQTDWTVDYESLEAELRKMFVESEVGKRLADKLVKVFNKAGDSRVLHFEIQGKKEERFPERIYIYNYRSRDRCNLPIGSVAILADEDPEWRPTQYVETTAQGTMTFTFTTIKLLDWVGREAELDAHPNPFALMVRAHLGSQALRDDVAARKGLKWLLIQQLYWRFTDRPDAVRWHRYLDWLLVLPPQDERELWERVVQYERERNVPFISVGERIGMEQALRAMLKGKFQEEGEALLSAFQDRIPPERFLPLIAAISRLDTLEEVRQELEKPS